MPKSSRQKLKILYLAKYRKLRYNNENKNYGGFYDHFI